MWVRVSFLVAFPAGGKGGRRLIPLHEIADRDCRLFGFLSA